jgi:hypothetical protein
MSCRHGLLRAVGLLAAVGVTAIGATQASAITITPDAYSNWQASVSGVGGSVNSANVTQSFRGNFGYNPGQSGTFTGYLYQNGSFSFNCGTTQGSHGSETVLCSDVLKTTLEHARINAGPNQTVLLDY